jgi:rhodanese-related sulfurtransferase
MISATVLPIVLAGCNGDDLTQAVEVISTADATELIQSNQGNTSFVIVDVRTPAEFAEGNIVNAQNIDFYSSEFSADIDALAKDNVYLVYCRSGGRSGRAVDMMADLGFVEVYDLDGGFLAFSQLDSTATLLAARTNN